MGLFLALLVPFCGFPSSALADSKILTMGQSLDSGASPAFTLPAASVVWDGTTATFTSGTGTKSDPYLISTGEQLAYLATAVNGGKTYSGQYFKLTGNIVLNNTKNASSWDDTTDGLTAWTPIGNSNNSFKGTFDGGGYSVSGIYINSTKDYQGLFGCIGSGGTVKNVGITDSYISSTASYVGGVAGLADGSTIETCSNTGAVSGGDTVGGIVGFVSRTSNSTIETCYNTGAVSGGDTVGGIAGYIARVGDIIFGTGKNAIETCYNTGAVSGESTVGGIAGFTAERSIIETCYNTGTVSGEGDSVGGIVGWAYSSRLTSGSGSTIKTCYSTGTVSGESTSVGGIVGCSYSSTIETCYSTGTVSGTNRVGGVVGEDSHGTFTSDYYCGYVGGIGKNGTTEANDAKNKTIPFVSYSPLPLYVGYTAELAELSADNLKKDFKNAFGITKIQYPEECQSANTDIVTFGKGDDNKKILTGVGAGSATVSGEITISQNVLNMADSTKGFSGAGTTTITGAVSLPITVQKITPQITAPATSDVTYGSPLSASTLLGGEAVNASGKAVAGTFAWAHPDTVVTTSGEYEVTFTPDDTAGYNTVSDIMVVVTVHKATPQITALTASNVTFDSPLSVSTFMDGKAVNASGKAVAGTFAWAHPDTAVTASGEYEVTFTPDDTTDYNTVSGIMVAVTMQKADTSVELSATPNSGTAGDTLMLTATVSGITGHDPTGTITFKDGQETLGSADLSSGEASYTWSSVPAGDHSLTAIYSGDDNYNASNGSLSYNAAKKAQVELVISGVPASVEYGGDTGFALNVGGGSGTGEVSYMVTGSSVSVDSSGNVAIRGVGDSTIIVTKAEDSIYNEVQKTLTISVRMGTPTIETKPVASNVVYGSPFSASTLSGGKAVNASGKAVAGTFAWAHPDTVVTAYGKYEVTFTPDDTTDYKTVSSIMVAVTALPTYSINVDTSITGGTVSVNSSSAPEGGIITVTVTANSGYTLVSGSLSYSDGTNSYPITGSSFPMPASDVTVTAKFKKASGGHSSGGSGTNFKPSLPLIVTNDQTGTAADLSGASFPPSVTGISLSVIPQTSAGTPVGTPGGTADPQGVAAYNFAIHDAALGIIGTLHLYNVKLLDQSGNSVTGFTGTVAVRLPIPAGLKGTPHVFRYESGGALTDMNAVVENGCLVFSTTHFSEYVIAGTGSTISLDTSSYQMPIGGKYQIGMNLTGKKNVLVKIHSTNDRIATAARLTNGNVQVDGKGTGTAWIMFDVYDDKNHLLTHVSTRIDVKTGIHPRGDSTRQIGIYTVSDTTNSLMIDTKSYEMPVGGKYQIGAWLTGGKAVTVRYYSANNRITSVIKLSNGNYQVTGNRIGTTWIMFDVYDDKNELLTHVSTRIDVKNGIQQKGNSTKQISVF